MLPHYWIVQLFTTAAAHDSHDQVVPEYEGRSIEDQFGPRGKDLDLPGKDPMSAITLDDEPSHEEGSSRGKTIMEVEELPAQSDDPKLECTPENKTYVVDFRVHLDDGIIKSVETLGDPKHSLETNLVSYIGGIFDKLNQLLWKYHVQLHLDLNSFRSSVIIGDKASNTTCPGNSPIEKKTFDALGHLKDTLKTKIGMQLFIWECNYLAARAKLSSDYENAKCGHLIGAVWMGDKATEGIIMKAILKALTNATIPEGVNVESVDPSALLGICKLMYTCVGLDHGSVGEIHVGRDMVKYVGRPHHAESNHPDEHRGKNHAPRESELLH